ncbi:MAG: hypothetical protein P1U42_11710 [Phycisphaerales bacterium]|nr:hypothetical protein [Phycisphaerales bacterium]
MPNKVIQNNNPSEYQIPVIAEYLRTVRNFRGSLIEAFASIGLDSSRPRETARQLGLDKSLVWKLTRVAHEDDQFRIASFMPGTSGLGMVSRAMQSKGVPEDSLHALETAYQDYLSMIDQHAGDRETLDLMLHGLAADGDERFRKSRQFAFRGNCGIWGVQSTTRVSSHILTINENDSRYLDYAQLGGILGFQRLRPGPSWPIFQFHSYEDTGGQLGSSMQAIDQDPDPHFPLLVRDHCVGELPEMHLACDPQSTSYEFGDGLIGKTGKCDAYFGYIDTEPKPRYQDERNRLGELLCIVDTPIQSLVLDLIVEREISEQISPEALIYGRATGPQLGHELRDQRSLVPYTEPLQRLESGPHMLTTPQAPGYKAASKAVMDRLGQTFDEFVCWRLIMQYPIMHSTVAIKFELPKH